MVAGLPEDQALPQNPKDLFEGSVASVDLQSEFRTPCVFLPKHREHLSLNLKDQDVEKKGTYSLRRVLMKFFHDLWDSELALLIVAQVQGTAKGAVDIVETNDIVVIWWIRCSARFLIRPMQNRLARNSMSLMKIGTQPDDAMDRARMGSFPSVEPSSTWKLFTSMQQCWTRWWHQN